MSAINAAIFYFSILFYFTCADDLTRSGVLHLTSGEWAKYYTVYVYMWRHNNDVIFIQISVYAPN